MQGDEEFELDYDDEENTIEVNDIEFNINNLDKSEKDNIVKQLYLLHAEEELEDVKSMKKKKYSIGIKLIFISLIFLPMLITLFVIGLHSNELITKSLHKIIFVFIIIFGIMFITGIMKSIFNKKSKTKKVRAVFKYIYAAFMTFYIFGCTLLLILLYGPVNDFRDWLVTTAMATMDHKHYCTWFYNQKEIDEVFSRNYTQEPEGSTDSSLINTGDETKPVVKTYKNEYERAVLEKDNEDDLYKIINLTVNGCKGYLAVIYDPSMVHVATTDRVGVRGQYVTTMAKREKALVAINGAGFHDPNYTSSGGCPKGITIVNGKIITNNEYGRPATGGLIGLTKDNKLVLLKGVTAQQAINQGVRDAVSWGPFLVVNGKSAFTKGNGGWGYAARTAIGQRADGIILMLVVDSNYNRTKGADMGDMTDIMVKYGAINATNLDGGTSSVMAVNGELISHPIDSALQNETRPVATSFVVKK